MRFARGLFSAVMVAALVFSAVPAYAVPTSILQSVTFVDATHGFYVGGTGNRSGWSSTSSDAGVTWSPVSSTSGAWFMDVTASDQNHALAVSNSDELFRTTNGGASWASAGAIFGKSARPSSIDRFANGNLIVGGTLVGTPDGDLAAIALSTDDAATWTTPQAGPIQVPSNEESMTLSTFALIADVDAAAQGSAGWAVGTEYNTSAADGSKTTVKQALIYRTADSGATWTTQTVTPSIAPNMVTCVAAADANTAFAGASGRYVLKTSNGGTTWTPILLQRAQIGNITNLIINGIAVTDANHVVAVGSNSGATGYVVWSNDGGTTWGGKMVTANVLRSVSMIDDLNWVAVGDNNTVVRTADGGVTWTSPQPGPTNGTLKGTVTRADNGAPIAGATVQVGAFPAATTGPDGSYVFSVLPAGLYPVTVSALGYTSVSLVDVTVIAGDSFTQNVALSAIPTPQPPPPAPVVKNAVSITRTPSKSSLSYKRKKGLAKYTLSARVVDASGQLVTGQRIYLQSSKNKKSWKTAGTYTTTGAGTAAKAFRSKSRSTLYYRWYSPDSSLHFQAYSGTQKVVVK